MHVRSLAVASLILGCLLQSVAAPVPRPAADYPAARAMAGELPGALAVDRHGYTYLAGILTAAAAGHAGGIAAHEQLEPPG
jgi:hypothetical protein